MGSTLDKRKGLKRLALAVGVPYFGGWWTFGILSYLNHQDAQRQFIESEPTGDGSSVDLWASVLYSTQQDLELAWRWGVLVPAVLLILSCIAYWVYRGFKPKTGQERA